jgi:hypothetical protein|tara:strand:+ start:1094 stop:2083 length:990 start_codon:yes stop_codon:yes gene_type:complete
MVKVESILKWKLEGPVLKKIKMMRAQILNKNEDAVAIPDSDLHITLASGPGWKEIRKQAKASDFDEPDFKIDIEPTFKVMEQGGRKSWYVRMKDQRNWKEYVMDLLQGTHDPRRVYHVSIANLTGKIGDSIPMVEDRDYKDEYKKFQSSKKMKRYRAELNRYNRRKGTYGNGDGKDASHKKGKIVGFENESKNRGRAEKSRLVGSKRSVNEDITKSDLDQIEKYADKLFAAVGIDVEFTRHFLDRANDERNKKPISTAELIGLFKKTYKKHGKKIPALGPDAEAVIKDMRTDINVPFVLNIDRDGMLDLVAKTVMRKQNFKTTNMELPV